MGRLLERIRGSVRVRTSGAAPETVLNLCAALGLDFWDVRKDGTELELTLYRNGAARLLEAGAGRGIEAQTVRRRGLPFLLRRLRQRWALPAAMALFLGAVWVSSFFIWEIRVSGNETVKTAVILDALRDLGVHIGACRLTISQERISNEVLQQIPELCWITVNTGGSRAEVLVRERVPRPEVLDRDAPVTVYAEKTGLIEKMTVLNGDPLHRAGDLVLAGEPLVRSRMESGSGTGGPRLVHAMAEVYARTWYERSAAAPLFVLEKRYTGRTETKTALVLAGNRLNLYFHGGNPGAYCDKITEQKKLILFGAVLPLTLVRETALEYVPEQVPADAEAVRAELEARLLAELESELGVAGEICRASFSAQTENGMMTVTLRAECRERIDAERPATAEEQRLP